MSLTFLFWLVFAVVILMAATGFKRSDAKVVVCGLFTHARTVVPP